MKEGEIVRSNLSAIRDRLEKARINWVIFAGAAAFCYGSNRRITDIDILVRCEDLKNAKASLKDVDFEGFDMGCGSKIKTEQGTCRFFLDDKMIERTQWKELFGVRVPVMSVEDNIVLKAILQRGEDLGKRDIEDIQDMIKSQRLDVDYLLRRIQLCHARKRVKPILQPLISNLF